MHSDLTLDIIDLVTTAVGQQFRKFKAKVCIIYTTRELHQEVTSTHLTFWTQLMSLGAVISFLLLLIKGDGLMDQVSQHAQEIRMIGAHTILIG
jgi:hypothetical protein